MARAEARVVDFSETEEIPEEDDRPRNSKGQLLTSKQVRSRARRTLKKGKRLSDEEFEAWSGKPIEDWDLEELARGRPRDSAGGFRGARTQYMPRAVHERIAERFKALIRDSMNFNATMALGVVSNLLDNNDTDDKGKPIVPPNVKLDASKWLIEHVIGKPVQPQTTDISVKLQGILGSVMVNPIIDDSHPDMVELPRGYSPAHIGTRGEVIDVESWENGEDDESFDD